VPVVRRELVDLGHGQPISAALSSPADLAAVLRQIHGRDIAEASRAARAHVERDRDVRHAASQIRALLPVP
jgi:hypothetical protein